MDLWGPEAVRGKPEEAWLLPGSVQTHGVVLTSICVLPRAGAPSSDATCPSMPPARPLPWGSWAQGRQGQDGEEGEEDVTQ